MLGARSGTAEANAVMRALAGCNGGAVSRGHAFALIVALLGAGCSAPHRDARSKLSDDRESEARRLLTRLGDGAARYAREHGRFPPSAPSMVPAADCCDRGGAPARCVPDPAAWEHPAWRALGFAITEPHAFRIAYTGWEDGSKFIASALADLDCTNQFTLYELTGELRNGQAVMRLTKEPYEPDPPGFVLERSPQP